MTYDLSVKQRIILVGLLPPVGDITSMKQVRILREELAFSDEENKVLKLEHRPDGQITWVPAGEMIKSIEIGDVMVEVIKSRLNELNDNKQLTESHVDIWDLFVTE